MEVILVVLLMLALVGGVAWFVARPFIEPRRVTSPTSQDHTISSLLAERDRVITSLQELDFDNTLGKIPAEDYPVQRAALLQRGAEVLKKLDELTSSNESDKDVESRIEAAIASRNVAPVVNENDDIESLIAARRSTRKEKSGGFCPKCGRPLLASDKFCPHCGKVIDKANV
jgi:NADH pyrophosphatase NudC (nudix superfamily)